MGIKSRVSSMGDERMHLDLCTAIVPLRLRNPFALAHGTSDVRHNVFLRIRQDGYEGWGEAAVVPYYGTTAQMVVEDLHTHAPFGKPIHPAAQNALSCALLALRVHQSGTNEREILQTADGPHHGPSCFTVAYDRDVDRTCALIEASGFRTIKIKGGFSDDLHRLQSIRDRFPSHVLYVDANQGWDFAQAARTIAGLSELDIALIEEPMKGTPQEIGRLQQLTDIPIILDETIQGEEDLVAYRSSISGVVVKLAKSGGPERARALIDRCQHFGLDVMLGCMVESSLAVTYALALAPLCRWLDVDGPLLLTEDMATPVTYEGDFPSGCVAALAATEALHRRFDERMCWGVQ